MKIGRIDREATARAGFKDRRSYVAHRKSDGKRVQRLYGEDMTALRRRIFKRDRFMCQDQISRNCRRGPLLWESGEWMSAELSHILARSNGGSDDEANCILSCNPCNQKRKWPSLP